jgi:Flp pilus assembly protein TadG
MAVTGQSARRRGEVGALTSAQLALIAPALLLLLTLIFQYVAWEDAQHIVQMAARRGADAARLQGGTPADGTAAAHAVLDHGGTGSVIAPSIEVSGTATTVRVVVSGDAPQLMPWPWHFPVRSQAVGPVERFNPPGAQP